MYYSRFWGKAKAARPSKTGRLLSRGGGYPSPTMLITSTSSGRVTPLIRVETMVAWEAVMSSGVEPLKDGTYFWFDQSNVDKWKVEKDKNLQGTFYDSGAFDIIQLPTDTDLPTIKTETQDIAMTALARAIYADTTEEAEAIIMQAREDLEDADIDQLAEYYSEQYKMYAEKWGL